MSVAGARTATVQFSLGQLAVVGMGVLYFANPDKFLSTLQKGAFLLADSPVPSSPQYQLPQAPIMIHQTGPSAGSSYVTLAVELVTGAGVCWGSYVLLTNILPEAAKGLLPVTNAVFSKAVLSLGRAVVNLKDTFMEQVFGLNQKQNELSEKQDETHGQVHPARAVVSPENEIPEIPAEVDRSAMAVQDLLKSVRVFQ